MSSDIESGVRASYKAMTRSAELQMEKFEEQAIDGHHGPVLCIDATLGLNYVVSGGEDCTARIWKFVQDDFQCYRLHHLLDHCVCDTCKRNAMLSGIAVYGKAVVCTECKAPYTLHPEKHERRPAVTSVAIAGQYGPAISVTRRGTLHVTDVDLKCHSHFQLFKESISDVRCKRDTYVSDTTGNSENVWLISVTSGSRVELYEIATDFKVAHYTSHGIARFEHDEIVKCADHVPGDVKHGAALASCTETGVRTWSIKGEMLSLVKFDSRRLTCLRVSRATDGWCWLAVSSTEKQQDGDDCQRLSFWPVKDGVFLPHYLKKGDWPLEYTSGIKEEVSNFSISPSCDFIMVQYKKASDFIQIAPSSQDAELKHNLSELVTIDGCPIKLFQEDLGRYLLSIPYKCHCNEMVMREDYDEEAVIQDGLDHFSLSAVLAFEDGSVGVWDLQGDDRGQQTSEMRSMMLKETVMPVVLRFISFAQVITFAFGPSTKFDNNIQKPVQLSTKLAQFDFLKEMMQNFLPSFSLADLFLPELGFAATIAVVYIILAVSGAPEHLATHIIEIRKSRSFDKGSCRICVRMFAGIVSIFRSMVCMLLLMCSTVLVVPMFKIFAKVAACDPEGGEVEVLVANPSIVCYEGFHLKLLCACSIVLPVYFMLLLPYAVVNGSSNFVVRSALFAPQEWRIHAERQATMIHQGMMHPKSESVFLTRVFELCIKIAMPCIVILTPEHPLFQTLAIFACGLGGYAIALKRQPLVDRTMNAAIQGGQLFTAIAMLCGVLTVCLPATRDYSIQMLIVGFAFCVVFTYFAAPSADKDDGFGKLEHKTTQARLHADDDNDYQYSPMLDHSASENTFSYTAMPVGA